MEGDKPVPGRLVSKRVGFFQKYQAPLRNFGISALALANLANIYYKLFDRNIAISILQDPWIDGFLIYLAMVLWLIGMGILDWYRIIKLHLMNEIWEVEDALSVHIAGENIHIPFTDIASVEDVKTPIITSSKWNRRPLGLIIHVSKPVIGLRVTLNTTHRFGNVLTFIPVDGYRPVIPPETPKGLLESNPYDPKFRS